MAVLEDPVTRPDEPTIKEVRMHNSSRTGPPDLRLLHYNDVYHVEAGSREPVGGIARFQTLCNYYRHDKSFHGQPELLTFFSGDAFNPSLESSVTKGKHMTPVLNGIGTDIACVGNHDLDFGIPQFRYLASQCSFPWLLANVLDPALGDDVPLGNAQRTVILTASNGFKIGVIGLVEREWLDTINSLPPKLKYLSASATAKELCPKLREQGADLVIAITHQREPNDIKLAEKTPNGLIDLILGGHDHYYQHSIIDGKHLLRSGTDFKQLSYIKAWKRRDGTPRWDFDIIRRDVVHEIPEDKPTLELISKLTDTLKNKLEKPMGYTLTPLDARFTTVRLKESNLGNFVCDLMRLYHQADCAIMAAGTIRGDQIYPAGVLKLKDLMNCFPFEDPVIVILVTGASILLALENAVSTYPALEGRFPQVSNITFIFDPARPPHNRITQLTVCGQPLEPHRNYKLATRGYMGRGKDGYNALLVKSEGGSAEEVVSEENGILISTILRQYFMSLKVLGRWKRWGKSLNAHWSGVHGDLHEVHPIRQSVPPSPVALGNEMPRGVVTELSHRRHQGGLQASEHKSANGHAANDIDSESESEDDGHLGLKHEPLAKHEPVTQSPADSQQEWELVVMRKVMRKWQRLVGVRSRAGKEEEGEFCIGWTRGIAPRLEGRIVVFRDEMGRP